MSALPGDPASNAFVFPPFVPPAPRPAPPAAEAAPAEPAMDEFAMEVPLPAHDVGDPDTDLPAAGHDGNEADAQPWEAAAPPATDDLPWLEMPAGGPRVHPAEPTPDAIPDWAPWDSSPAPESAAAPEPRPDSAYEELAPDAMPWTVDAPPSEPQPEPAAETMFTPDEEADAAPFSTSDYDARPAEDSGLGFDSSEPTAAFQSTEPAAESRSTDYAPDFDVAEPATDAQEGGSEFRDDEPVTDFGGVPDAGGFGAVDPVFGYGATESSAEVGAAELDARFGDDATPVSNLASADEDFAPAARFDDAPAADPTAPSFTLDDARSEPAPADDLPAFYAAPAPRADGYGEVADRLEAIARALRDDPAAFLAGGSGDALGLLVTGFVMGYGHGRREG